MLPTLELWALRAAAIAALLVFVWWKGDVHGREVEKAAQAVAIAAAQAEVKRVNDAMQTKAQEADHAQELNRIALARATAATGAELQRLRDEVARGRDLPGSAANPGLAAYAAVAAGLVEKCADRYSAVAHDADDSAGRLGGLQRLVHPTDAAASSVHPQEVTP
jgi:hypothetical protein